MIALIVYESKISKRPDIRKMFEIWYEFYKNSGTKMAFRIFTGPDSDIEDMEGFPVTKIMQPVPVSKNKNRSCLAYGDYLRASCYAMVQQPVIYMDIDTLILRPLDPLLSTEVKTIGMCSNERPSKRRGKVTCSLILFKADVQHRYHELFCQNFEDFTKPTKLKKARVYGQRIWNALFDECGTLLPPTWITSRKRTTKDMNVIHLHGGKALLFHQLLKHPDMEAEGWIKKAVEDTRFIIEGGS